MNTLREIDTKDPKAVANYLRAMGTGSAAKLTGQAAILNAAADFIDEFCNRTGEAPAQNNN